MDPKKSTVIVGEVNRRDVFLTFLDWLYTARKSWGLRLFYRTSDLENIKIWDLGEDGAFHQFCRTQYEETRYQDKEIRGSYAYSLEMHREADLPFHRPEHMHFVNMDASYPLQGSGMMVKCPRCRGRGRVTYRDSNGNSRSKRCPRCKGDREVFKFRSKYYHWSFQADESPILSPNSSSVSTDRLVSGLIDSKGGYEIETITEEEVLRVSNLLNPRIKDLVNHAKKENQAFKAKIASRGKILFQREILHFIPISYINLEVGTRFGQFFLAGDRKKSRMRRPPLRLDPWKIIAGLGLLSFPVLSLLSATPRFSGLPMWIFPLIPVTFIPFGVSQLLTRLRKRKRESWVIVDNPEYDGWHLSYLLAYSLSRQGRGNVSDPAFTHLLDAPDQHETSSRNSFLFHLEVEGQSPKKKDVIEVLNMHHDSLDLYPKETSPILKRSENWLVMVGKSFDPHEEKLITDLLNWRIKQGQKLPEITILVTGEAPDLGDYFQDISNDYVREKVRLFHLPLRQLTESIKSGELAAEHEPFLEGLVQHFLPGLPQLSQTKIQ